MKGKGFARTFFGCELFRLRLRTSLSENDVSAAQEGLSDRETDGAGCATKTWSADDEIEGRESSYPRTITFMPSTCLSPLSRVGVDVSGSEAGIYTLPGVFGGGTGTEHRWRVAATGHRASAQYLRARLNI